MIRAATASYSAERFNETRRDLLYLQRSGSMRPKKSTSRSTLMRSINTPLSIPLLVLLTLLSSCSKEEESTESGRAALPEYAATPAPSYTQQEVSKAVSEEALIRIESAASLGIDFIHNTGAVGDKLMPETMGPGCALFDYDGDDALDLLFTDGRPWTPPAADPVPRPLARLYRNEAGGRRFREVTKESALEQVGGYGMGVAVADYDADGDPDLLLTTVSGGRLLRNDNGRYVEVTAAAGLGLEAPGWATSAAWLDADGDGWLDLFIAHYVKWSPQTDLFTTLDGVTKSYATPQVYQGLDNRLYRNLGDGRFADITSEAGLDLDENKALGVVVLDANGDYHPDLFVSNDTVANKLYINDGEGRFSDTALLVGVGYDEMGEARAGMGVDVTRSPEGVSMIGIGNFSDEAVSLYEAVTADMFADQAQRRGLATETLPRLTFGTRFADLDHDGRDDLILVNGHIEPEIQRVQSAVSYRQPIDIFLAQAEGRFVNLAEQLGRPVSDPVVGRCLALGDLDNDGDLDGLVAVNGGAPLILRNTQGGERSVLIDLLDPSGANRAALGAEVLLSAEGWRRSEQVRARGSYLGHSPYTLHFGLPEALGERVKLSVRWPDGAVESYEPIAVGGHYRIVRGGEVTRVRAAEGSGV